MKGASLAKRVCAITVPYPGVVQWLTHGYDEGLWDLRLLESGKSVEVPEADLYLLGAWSPAYVGVVQRLRAMQPQAKIAVAWSSSPGEMDGAQIEIVYSLALTSKNSDAPIPIMPQIDAWATLHPDMVHHFPNSVHLPAPIHLEEARTKYPAGEGVGFFAPNTPKKNVFTQLLAVRRFQQKYAELGDEATLLHTNLNDYKPIIDGYGIHARYYDWLPRAEFLKVLGQRRIVMCASTYESWSYLCVDAMMQNVPVVGSPTIPWLPEEWKAEPNSPESIVDTMGAIWEHRQAYASFPRLKLEAVAERQNQAAKEAVERLLGPRV